jgi:hypothetical protein
MTMDPNFPTGSIGISVTDINTGLPVSGDGIYYTTSGSISTGTGSPSVSVLIIVSDVPYPVYFTFTNGGHFNFPTMSAYTSWSSFGGDFSSSLTFSSWPTIGGSVGISWHI